MLHSVRIVFCTFVLLVPGYALALPVPVPLNTTQDPWAHNFDPRPDVAVSAARQLVAAGKLDDAIAGLARYVAAYPKEIGPGLLLGDLYYRKGNLRAAERTYSALLNLYPNNRDAYNRLGAVYATENRVDDAIAAYNKSLPGSDVIGSLVELHSRKGDLVQYKRVVERDAGSNPLDSDLQAELGEVYYYLGQYDVALSYLNRALDITPTNLIALNYKGLAYLGEYSYQKSVEAFDQCLRAYTSDYSCMVNLASADLERGRLEDAKPILDRAVGLRPENADAFVNLGYYKDLQGDWKAAIAYYVRALAASPYSREAYQNLANDYERHHLYELAESALIKGITVAPYSGQLHYLLGKTYEDQGKTDLALQQYRAAYNSREALAQTWARTRLSALHAEPAI